MHVVLPCVCLRLCRPPAAFKTVKSLSASSPGHVLLLEYLEQRPLMMLQTGMGMRLTTYYRCGSSCCGCGENCVFVVGEAAVTVYAHPSCMCVCVPTCKDHVRIM
jgi:hypothetical protein